MRDTLYVLHRIPRTHEILSKRIYMLITGKIHVKETQDALYTKPRTRITRKIHVRDTRDVYY